MGIYTIVTDWYPVSKSPAKEIADEYAMVSTSDVKAVVDLINRKKVDGVITGFTDSTLQYYQKVCELAGLPCYATSEQINITTDKKKFKQLCKQFDVPVVEEYTVNMDDINEINSLEFPIIVKPADNSGARGISICNNKEELLTAYRKALDFSDSKNAIIERYIKAKEATIFYVLNDGEILLTGIGDRHVKTHQEGIIPLPVAYTFPSEHTKTYVNELNGKVVNMFKSIGMTDGMIFIQSFVENGNFIFYEMGYRLTGSLEYKLIDKLLGINPLKMMIEFALTGRVEGKEKLKNINPHWNQYGCNITFLSKPGQIGKIEGVSEALAIPGVLDVFPSYKAGDIIPESATGTLQQVILRAFAIAKSKKELAAVMNQIHNTIRVTSINNEDLLLEKFDVKEYYNGN
ncbi:MAG: ATP-grasp domain-containing protein [Caldicoprobacterales bacterium]